MRKLLLTTSALVAAAAMSSSASAAEWQAGVSGYMHVGLGITDSDSANDGFGVMRDGEVYLNARLTADNGITFGTVVQLEAWSQGGDQIDENYVFVDGSFGRLEIGGNDDAMYSMVSSLASFGVAGYHIGYQDQFGLTGAGVAGAGAGVLGFGTDAIGVHYYTPRFFGFQVGASYIPDIRNDNTGDPNPNKNDNNNFAFEGPADAWAIAANYVGDFGDFGFDIGLGYADADNFPDEKLGIAGGVSFGGFGVRAYYEDDGGSDEYGFGAQYATGPWTFGAGYSDSNAVDVDIAAGWVAYALAPGVTTSFGIEWAEQGPDNDFGGAVMLSLSF